MTMSEEAARHLLDRIIVRRVNQGLDDFRMGRASNDAISRGIVDELLSSGLIRTTQPTLAPIVDLADAWQAEVEDDGDGMTQLGTVLAELRTAITAAERIEP